MRADVKRGIHEHKNCNLSITKNQASLTGPSCGHIALGVVDTISTSDGNPYHVEIGVYRHQGAGRYWYETWFVRFLDERADK